MNCFDFFQKTFFQNLSCQTRGVAYLRVRLICQCLWCIGMEWNDWSAYWSLLILLHFVHVRALGMTSSCFSVVQCCFIGAIYLFVRRFPTCSHPWDTVVDECSFVGGGTNFFPLYASVVPWPIIVLICYCGKYWRGSVSGVMVGVLDCTSSSLWFVLVQGTWLSQCLSTPRCTVGTWWIQCWGLNLRQMVGKGTKL